MRSRFFALIILTAISFTFLFGGCGGGVSGGDGGGGGQDEVVTNEVAGAVNAPNGHVAFKGKRQVLDYLANLLIPSVSASVSGLLAVQDGTQVDLIRLTDAATPG